MTNILHTSLALVALSLSALSAMPVQAAPNGAITGLQQTPVSLFTYGLDALGEGVNDSIGRGKTPPSFAMFKAPLSGKIADMATVIPDIDNGTITVNLVRIENIDVGADGADEACAQGIALLRLIAELDPATGQLQTNAGMKNSGLADYFSATGTVASGAAADLTTLDQSFRLRYVFGTNAGHFECRAPLFGTDHTLKKMGY